MKIKQEFMDKLEWFEGSPDAGDTDCTCSLCKKPIKKDDCPVKMWDNTKKPVREIRFHKDCFSKIIEDG